MTQPQQPESERPTPDPLTQQDLAELKQSKTVDELLAMVQQKIEGRRAQQQLIAQQQEREQRRKRQCKRTLARLASIALLAAIGIFALRPLYCPYMPATALCAPATAEPDAATPTSVMSTVTTTVGTTTVPAQLDTVSLQRSGTSNSWTWVVKAVGDDGSTVPDVTVNFTAGASAVIENSTVTTDEAGTASAVIAVTDGTSPTLVTAAISAHADVEEITENILAFVPVMAVSVLDFSTEPVRAGDRIAIRFTLNNYSTIAAENVRFSLRLPAGLEREHSGSDAPSGCDETGLCHWDRGSFAAFGTGDFEIQLIATTAGEYALPADGYWLTFDGASVPTYGDLPVAIVVEPYAVATIEISPTLPYLLPGLDFTLNVRLLDADGALFTQPQTIQLSSDRPDILLTDNIPSEQLTTSTGELTLQIPTTDFANGGTWTEAQIITYTLSAGSIQQARATSALPTSLAIIDDRLSAALRSEADLGDANVAVFGLPDNTPVWTINITDNEFTDNEFRDVYTLLWVPKEVDTIPVPGTIPDRCLIVFPGFTTPPQDTMKGECGVNTSNQKYWATATLFRNWKEIETIVLEEQAAYKLVLAHGWVRDTAAFFRQP